MSDDIDLGALPPGTPSYIKPVDPMQRQLSPIGFYSHAAEVAARFPQMKGTPQQFKAMLMRQGVKPDELKWSGYDQAFGDQKMVTRDQLAQHFKMKMPKVQETVLDRNPNNYSPKGTPTKYHSYTLPGGKNYREVLLHLPPTPNKLTLWRVM